MVSLRAHVCFFQEEKVVIIFFFFISFYFKRPRMVQMSIYGKERVYGKARYSQIRRYSQIQNGLAKLFNRTRDGGFLYTLAYKEGGKPC